MSLKTRLIPVLLIAAAMLSAFLFRSWFSREVMPPPSRMQAETTQSYRYARMFSMNGSIPAVDTLVMHPDGFSTSENSIFEEYLAGGLHRIVGGDFDSFIRYFCLLFPLLVIPFLYLWMRSSGYGIWNAASAASLYGFLLPAILRSRGESLYRETVALPFLVALGWLTERSLASGKKDSSIPWSIGAGAALFISLAAWKVTAFLVLFLLFYLLWRDWLSGDVPFHLKLSLASAQIIASVLLSHLRHDGAITGPSTVAALFLLIPFGRARSRTGLFLAVAATVGALLSAFIGQSSTGHVSAVITAKLRFMFSHPADPSMLSDDARLFWVPGYTSPTPAQILLLFGIPLLAAIPGAGRFLRDRNHRLVFWFLIVSLAGYLFFDRLMVFLAVALVPVIACSFRRKWMILPVAALVVLQSIFPGQIAGALTSAGLEFRDSASLLSDRELDTFLNWVSDETDENQAILSYWHISGLVSAYADRPVVTHTFFENSDNRETILSFARSIFSTEDSLVSFMRHFDCQLLVYQADFLLDRSSSGLLYLAGLQSVPDDAVAWRLQYDPHGLDSLVPVFQGPSLRVFSLSEDAVPELERSFLFQPRYIQCYEGYDEARAILSDMRGWSGHLADRAIRDGNADMLSGALLLGLQGSGPSDVTERMLNDLIQLYIQGEYDLESLAEDVDSFTFFCGERPGMELLLARLFASEGKMEESRDRYLHLLQMDPGNGDAAAELELVNQQLEGNR